MLLKKLVGLGMQRVGGGIPNDLVDAHDLAESVQRPRRIEETDEKDVELFTLDGSMAPLNGMLSRGWRLKPSRVLMTSRSDGQATQSGFGRLTRSQVFCVVSNTVNRSLGKGPPDGVLRSNSGCTSAASAGVDKARTMMRARASLR